MLFVISYWFAIYCVCSYFIYTLIYIHICVHTHTCVDVGNIAQGYEIEPILHLTEVGTSVVYCAVFLLVGCFWCLVFSKKSSNNDTKSSC